MKGLTLTNPYGQLMALGAKTIETRSWGTRYRGCVAIHTARSFPREDWERTWQEPFASTLLGGGYTSREKYETGYIIAVGVLVDCTKMRDDPPYHLPFVSAADQAFGHFAAGRWAWWFDKITRLEEPIYYKGMLGLWEIPVATLTWREITKQL